MARSVRAAKEETKGNHDKKGQTFVMRSEGQETALWSNVFRLSKPSIRVFHMSWLAFFLCFFAWFGIAPLMVVIRDELRMSPSQIGWCLTASVAMTIVARLVIGVLCDHFGPRRTYTGLLILGSIPVFLISLAHDPWTFIVCRLLIGVIGASFVITQYHTARMFAPNVVGTATATTAGWGNLGGGAAQAAMPLLFGIFVAAFGWSRSASWRACMVLAGLLCLTAGVAYFFLTQDGPDGDHRRAGAVAERPVRGDAWREFRNVCSDYRVWLLFAAYGACFGIELTLNNIVVLYFVDSFQELRSGSSIASLQTAGLVASLFGATNLFARTLGGFLGDASGARWGLRGRVWWLFAALLSEGIALMCFSQVGVFHLAVPALVLLGIFVQMAEGATFAIVPFVRRESLGTVAGIVGAGGNIAAMAAGAFFGGVAEWSTSLLWLGVCVTAISLGVLAIRFSPEIESATRRECAAALRDRRSSASPRALQPA